MGRGEWSDAGNLGRETSMLQKPVVGGRVAYLRTSKKDSESRMQRVKGEGAEPMVKASVHRQGFWCVFLNLSAKHLVLLFLIHLEWVLLNQKKYMLVVTKKVRY